MLENLAVWGCISVTRNHPRRKTLKVRHSRSSQSGRAGVVGGRGRCRASNLKLCSSSRRRVGPPPACWAAYLFTRRRAPHQRARQPAAGVSRPLANRWADGLGFVLPSLPTAPTARSRDPSPSFARTADPRRRVARVRQRRSCLIKAEGAGGGGWGLDAAHVGRSVGRRAGEADVSRAAAASRRRWLRCRRACLVLIDEPNGASRTCTGGGLVRLSFARVPHRLTASLALRARPTFMGRIGQLAETLFRRRATAASSRRAPGRQPSRRRMLAERPLRALLHE